MDSTSFSLKMIVLMWQFGFIDTFTLLQCLYNASAQYRSVVVAALADGNISQLPTVPFEAIVGFKVSYDFIRTAQTVAEKKARIATVAALLSASVATVASSTPAANAAMGGAVAAHIKHMRDVIRLRGGEILGSLLKNSEIILDSVKLTVTEIHQIHPFHAEFTQNSKIIIQNIFESRKMNRYLKTTSFSKYKYIAPITASSQLTLNTIGPIKLIGFTICGVGVIIFTSLGTLYLFQRSERERNSRIQNIILDTAVIDDEI